MGITLVLRLNCALQLLYFAKCNLHLYCDFSMFCIILVNQKSHVMSNLFKQINLILNITLHMWNI